MPRAQVIHHLLSKCKMPRAQVIGRLSVHLSKFKMPRAQVIIIIYLDGHCKMSCALLLHLAPHMF